MILLATIDKQIDWSICRATALEMFWYTSLLVSQTVPLTHPSLDDDKAWLQPYGSIVWNRTAGVFCFFCSSERFAGSLQWRLIMRAERRWFRMIPNTQPQYYQLRLQWLVSKSCWYQRIPPIAAKHGPSRPIKREANSVTLCPMHKTRITHFRCLHMWHLS